MGSERIIHANGVDLCVETFGDPTEAAILLIMGSGASMDWWRDDFCERLAAGSRLVVRYDLRDTGRSISYEPGAPGYTEADLVDDAAGLIEALGLGQAHLVGMSMGGAIAQLVALHHPDRVSSLTLIATSPAVPGEDDRGLPSMTQQARARFAAIATPDWTDRAAMVDYIVAIERACAGSGPFDEAEWRELAGRVFDRTTDIESALTNHDALSDDDRPRAALGSLKLPTLVIHGTDDPVLAHPHGLSLASEIPGARMLTLDGVGHELPGGVWDEVVPAIISHTSRDAGN